MLKKKSSLPFNTKKKPVAPSWNSFLHLSFYFHQEKSCGERKTRGADAVRQMGVSTSPRAAAAVVDSLVCNFLIKRSRAASTRIATLEWASLSFFLDSLPFNVSTPNGFVIVLVSPRQQRSERTLTRKIILKPCKRKCCETIKQKKWRRKMVGW